MKSKDTKLSIDNISIGTEMPRYKDSTNTSTEEYISMCSNLLEQVKASITLLEYYINKLKVGL